MAGIKRKVYGPDDFILVKFKRGKDILCAQRREGLGSYAKFIEIDMCNINKPYKCKILHSNKIYNFAWIATL